MRWSYTRPAAGTQAFCSSTSTTPQRPDMTEESDLIGNVWDTFTSVANGSSLLKWFNSCLVRRLPWSARVSGSKVSMKRLRPRTPEVGFEDTSKNFRNCLILRRHRPWGLILWHLEHLWSGGGCCFKDNRSQNRKSFTFSSQIYLTHF
jgi:hypothetical protein